MRLTQRFVATARATGMESWYMDDEVRGLGLRVWTRRDGVVMRSYFVRYRQKGPQYKLKIGDPTRMSVEEARKEARRLLALVDSGRNPAAERKAEAEEPTMADLAARYLQFHASKTKSHDRVARALKVHVLPTLGKKKVKDVTRADAERLAYRITQDGKPVAANRVLALLSALMNYAEGAGMRPEGTNPCRRLKRNPERSRERFLTMAELERLGAALAAADPGDDHAAFHRPEAKEHPSAIAAIRLLLLTGCRKSEILTLRWEHVDLDRSCLRLPDSKTGAKVVPLGAPAKALLASLARREGNPYVCWGDKGDGHLVGLFRAWDRIRKAAGLPDLRLHDLRHSFASVGAGSGHGLPVIGKLLGHATPATTARYAHLADDPLQRAADAISAEIAAALASRTADVVALSRVAG